MHLGLAFQLHLIVGDGFPPLNWQRFRCLCLAALQVHWLPCSANAYWDRTNQNPGVLIPAASAGIAKGPPFSSPQPMKILP